MSGPFRSQRSDLPFIDLSLSPYNIVPDVDTDFSAEVTGAIAALQAAGNQTALLLPRGTVKLADVEMEAYTKIIGNGSVIELHQDTTTGIALLHDPGTLLQVTEYGLVQGVVFDGVDLAAGSVGFKSSSPTLVLRDVKARRLETGFFLHGSQFGTAYSVKAYGCTVGMFLSSLDGFGGGNSWSFYDYQGISNKVGVVIKKDSTQPHHSVYFRNASLLHNTVAAAAIFDTNDVVFDGLANEHTGSGDATLSYGGETIKKASIYISGARATIKDGYVAEATLTPAIIAESGSTLHMNGISGYGNSAGELFQADATSKVFISGDYACLGRVNNAIVTSATLSSESASIVAAPNRTINPRLPNEVVLPQMLSAFGSITGALSEAIGRDADYGQYRSVTFDAVAGGSSSNRFAFSQTIGGTSAVASFLAQSSVATLFRFGISGITNSFRQYQLPAGEWVRLVWKTNVAVAGAQSMLGHPSDAVGPTIKFCQWQLNSGADGYLFAGKAAQVMSGAYNPKINAEVPTHQAAAAPTTGTWAVGDIVWNSAPAASGTMGWVCTTAGTPGTWKTFGAIAS